MKKKIKEMYSKEFYDFLSTDKAKEFVEVLNQLQECVRPISIYKKLLKLIELFEKEVEVEDYEKEN